MEDGAYGPRLRRLRVAYLVGMVLFLALFRAWTRFEWPDTRAFVDVSTTVVSLGAGVLALVRSRHLAGPRRRAWALLGGAALAWGAGNAAWTWYELVLQVEAPLPSWADAGYLLLLPLAAAGLLVLVTSGTAAASRLRSLLDGVLIAGGLAFVAWVPVLQPIVDAALGDPSVGLAAQVVSLAYPIGDIILISLLLLVLSRAAPSFRPTLLWIGFAILSLTYADVGYWYLNAKGTYATGSIFDSGWTAAFLFLGYASIRPTSKEPQGEARPGLALTVIPLLPVVAALAGAMAQQAQRGSLDPFLFWMGMLLVGVLVLRQFLVLFENIGLRREAERALARVKEQQAERTMMLNTVTHDIMSPLSTVRIQLRILESRQDLDAKAGHSLAIVGRNVEQVGRLARDLKDLAILEAGHFQLDRQPIDLAVLARQASEGFLPAAREAGLALSFRDDASLPCVGDRHRMDQVLHNLMSNAIRYTKEGSIMVWCHRRGGVGVVAVRDSGRGLDPDEIGRLFRPFSQVHAKDEARDKGSGLGLFISRAIAESHGGTLRVESMGRGKGSTFFLEVPLDLAAATEGAPKVAPRPEAANA